MVKEATLAKAEVPYMHRYYNVKRVHADNNEHSTNALLRIVNCFIQELNENAPLPRMILVFPDKDVIQALGRENLDHGVGNALGKCIDKLLSIIDRSIETKKADMYFRRPGSIAPGEPKLIWIKMLRRYGFTKHPIFTLQEKFNEILEEALLGKKHTYIMDLDECVTSVSFDRNAELRPMGLIELWNEINDQVQKFDRQQITLKPKIIKEANKQARADNYERRQHRSPTRKQAYNGSGDNNKSVAKSKSYYNY